MHSMHCPGTAVLLLGFGLPQAQRAGLVWPSPQRTTAAAWTVKCWIASFSPSQRPRVRLEPGLGYGYRRESWTSTAQRSSFAAGAIPALYSGFLYPWMRWRAKTSRYGFQLRCFGDCE